MSKIFRSSFMGGFRKKDVISYLDELGAEKRELERKLEHIRSEPSPISEDVLAQRDGVIAFLNTRIEELEIDCEGKSGAEIQLRREIAERNAEINSLRANIAELAEAKQASHRCDENRISEMTLAIKCGTDSMRSDAIRGEEALREFSKSVDEITREFSRLLDTMSVEGEAAAVKSSEKLSSIKDILARVRAISEK